MAEFTNPHMVKQTISYSDGTETVINYRPQENAESIEEKVAEDVFVADEMSEVSGTESVEVGEVSSTEEVSEVVEEE